MRKFDYKNIEDLKRDIERMNLNIGLSEDISNLSDKLKIGERIAENRIAILPMEGCDSESDGSPSFFTYRRYLRFFLGGAALIWWEANAVVREGRANPRQMMITDDNKGIFKAELRDLKRLSEEKNGYSPLSILQLTHSGRYSNPEGKRAPMVLVRDPILDRISGVESDSQVVTDEYLESLVPHYVHSAELAKEAGFDGVDVKACHRYLFSEMLSSQTRGGKYGGSFENRISLILRVIEEIRKRVGDDFIIASRFNVFDAHPYPYGFGEGKDDMWSFDPSEPVELSRRMVEKGVDLLSNSAGNPYYIYPQVTRPFDTSSEGIPEPEESQLKSISRLFEFTETIQRSVSVPVIGNGYSWLREYLANAGSYNIEKGRCQMIGLGREAIAYPEAPNDILKKGSMERSKCCITCSKCTQMMRDKGIDGCVVRDSELYASIFRKQREEAERRKNG